MRFRQPHLLIFIELFCILLYVLLFIAIVLSFIQAKSYLPLFIPSSLFYLIVFVTLSTPIVIVLFKLLLQNYVYVTDLYISIFVFLSWNFFRFKTEKRTIKRDCIVAILSAKQAKRNCLSKYTYTIKTLDGDYKILVQNIDSLLDALGMRLSA